MLKSIKSRIKNFKTVNKTVIITATKGLAIELDTSPLEVKFQFDKRHIIIFGRINVRTNFVRFNSNEKEESALNKLGINLNDIALQIEEYSIPLNH